MIRAEDALRSAPSQAIDDRRTSLAATMPGSPPPPAGEVLPFQPAPPLTLEQMASLSVELQTWPAARGATLARYGVPGEETLRVLEERWRERRESDAGVAARWNAACDLYVTWLHQRAENLSGAMAS